MMTRRMILTVAVLGALMLPACSSKQATRRTAEMEQTQAEIADLKDKLAQTQRDLVQAAGEIKLLETAVADGLSQTRDDVAIIERQHDEHRQRLEGIIAGLGDQVDQLVAEVTTLQSSVTQLRTSDDLLKDDVRAMADTVRQLEAENAKLTERLAGSPPAEEAPGEEETVPSDTPERAPVPITRAQYDRIELGMTYQQVVEIFGSPGTKQPERTTSGSNREAGDTYRWSVGETVVTARFEDDELISKTRMAPAE